MNRSGDIFVANPDFCPGVGRIVLIACDQMDLPPGALRLKTKGGTAGHNGLKSINTVIGQEFLPLYFGIGRPGPGETVVDYVLGIPESEQLLAIESCLNRAQAGVMMLLTQGLARAMNELNRKDHAETIQSPG